MQQEQQGAAADEVEDDERRERSERVDVVGGRELTAAPQRLAEAAAFEQRSRDREPSEREPRDCRQDVQPDERRNRQEDDDADRKRGQERSARVPLPGRDRAGADVREREERRGEDEQGCLHRPALAERELVEGRHDQAKRERGPEPPAEEPDRLGHELADGSVRGRELDACVHGGTLSRAYPSASTSSS